MSTLELSPRTLELAKEAQAALREQFDAIDEMAERNSRKVLAAFQTHRVAEACFAGTTGYGYDDLGRDTLDKIYADIFRTEDALVRIQFVNGTHAIASCLYGVLEPGDVLLSAVGAPYDTIQGVIGMTGDYPLSLKRYGIEYR
ncbi:MAG: methionine gamma-lyase family protein, partial [Clostridiales bacterium]|nr:methionine gamma-lyase family protein [Clostridiales bacterium]